MPTNQATNPAILDTRVADAALVAAAMVVTWLLLPIWQALFAVDTWRHDALVYLASFDAKLAEEGRWLNYLLFDWLRELNPYLSISLHLGCFAGFVFIAAWQLCKDRYYAALIALFSLCAAPLYIQLLWPLNSLPAFLLLAGAVALRGINTWIFFILMGCLFFGTMSNLYFLLPLLFIRPFVDMDEAGGHGLLRILRQLVAPWVVGYILGFLLAQGVTMLLTHGETVQLAAWRRPNPASDLTALYHNLLTAGGSLSRDLYLYAAAAAWWQLLAVLALLAYQLFSSKRGDHLLIPVLVMLSLYASTLPYSVALSYRTSLNLWLGLVFLLLIPAQAGSRARLFYSVIVTTLAFTVSAATREDIHWYQASTEYYRQELRSILDRPAQDYEGIVVLTDRATFQVVEATINEHLGLNPGGGIKTIGTPGRWLPIAREAGFTNPKLCAGNQTLPICSRFENTAGNDSKTSPNGLYHYQVVDGWLLINAVPLSNRPD